MSGQGSPLRKWIRRQNEAIDIAPYNIILPQLAQAQDSFRVAVLSDLHLQQLGAYHERILDAVRCTQPGCIFILGDTIDKQTPHIGMLTPFFRRLTQLAPTVAILGNNDCLKGRIFSLRDMYRESGVILLENETRMLNVNGYPLQITGMMDPRAQKIGIEPERAETQQEYVPISKVIPQKEKEDVVTPSLLLVHRPETAMQYMSLRPSLILSGHAHGGQFRVPRIGGLYAPGQGIFPRYTSGLYPMGGTCLLVSRGLGNHSFPLRLNNPPHLPVIVLRRAEA